MEKSYYMYMWSYKVYTAKHIKHFKKLRCKGFDRNFLIYKLLRASNFKF